MGKATGFLEYDRTDNRVIPPEERLKSFGEFRVPLREDERRRQGARCMDCGAPFCQSAMELAGMVTGCPLHNLIPEWNHELYMGHLPQALSRLLKKNNFPEFTGRVCPALCEKACILGRDDLPVTSHDNELYIIETAFREGYMTPRSPSIRSGRNVAVVGSGPSGLAAADQLNRRGHSVTVFERDDRIGGLLMYGIPNMKLDKDVILRRRALMEQEGVCFRTGVDVGKDLTAQELREGFDAVILCCGAKEPRQLEAADPGSIDGVMYAVDFLRAATKEVLRGRGAVGDEAARDCLPEVRDRHVVVVGGGDTGNDCIATVLRLGCASVTALEMMPEPPAERAASNPWPQWPKVLKTDYGHEESISIFGRDPRLFGTTVRSCSVNDKGSLTAVTIVRGKFSSGKWTDEPGSEETIPCDLLIIAAGFTGCESYVADAFSLALTGRGTIATPPGSYASSVPGVFSAGDMRRGQSLVVWAIAEGRACAAEVDAYLMGYTAM